jgi:hypothetical protein
VQVFQVNGASYLLGRPGEIYHWNVYGKLTTQGPPAAQICRFCVREQGYDDLDGLTAERAQKGT